MLCSTATFASSIRYSSTSLALRRYTGSVKAPLSPFPRRISLSLSHTHTLSNSLWLQMGDLSEFPFPYLGNFFELFHQVAPDPKTMPHDIRLCKMLLLYLWLDMSMVSSCLAFDIVGGLFVSFVLLIILLGLQLFQDPAECYQESSSCMSPGALTGILADNIGLVQEDLAFLEGVWRMDHTQGDLSLVRLLYFFFVAFSSFRGLVVYSSVSTLGNAS